MGDSLNPLKGIVGGDGSSGRKLPRWAKFLFFVSVILMVAGLVIPVFNAGPSGSVGGVLKIPATAAAALTGDAQSDGNLTQPEAPEYVKWSPMMFRIGFGFFVGFTVAFAMRAYVKMAVVALAFFLITGFGLQHEGFVDVKWTKVEEQYAKISTDIGDGAKKASEKPDDWMKFLPVGSAAAAGLVAGFMRRRA